MNKNKYALQGELKQTQTAYLLWFFLGAHYAYMGRWGIQLLYWFTLGGIGLWILIDAFRISGMVERYNSTIYQQIEEMEKKEIDDAHARNLAIVSASRK